MSLAKGDRSLQEELDWAVERLARAGYPVRSKVRLLVDPNLEIMGYANEESGVQHIVIAEWALHSEMLGGLLFHELAHIYHTERKSPSHKPKVTNAMITEISLKEGLNERETGYLVEGFNHLQNVLVDDIVFKAMEESEKRQAKGFFMGWMTEAPSGFPLVDSSALSRNAFAAASIKRHNLIGEDEPAARELDARSRALVRKLGAAAQAKYDVLEEFFISADPGWNEKKFKERFAYFLDLLVGLLRENDQMKDLR